MKTTASKMFLVALLAIVMGSLVGCTTTKVKMMGDPVTIGNKQITFIGAEWVNPCAGNGLSILAYETDLQQPCVPQVVTQAVAQPVHYDRRRKPYTQGHTHRQEHTYTQEHPMRTQQYVMSSSNQGNTRLVNSNNSATTGIINNAFAGSVQGAFIAGGLIGGAAVMPRAGGARASSSSSSAAAAAASGG